VVRSLGDIGRGQGWRGFVLFGGWQGYCCADRGELYWPSFVLFVVLLMVIWAGWLVFEGPSEMAEAFSYFIFCNRNLTLDVGIVSSGFLI